MNGIKAAIRSTNTTTLGVLAVIAAAVQVVQLLMDGDPETMPDFNILGMALLGLMGILAKDGNKSSQDVGLRP